MLTLTRPALAVPILAGLLGASVLGTVAARAQAPVVKADNAWARATPASAKVGAVYVTLTSPAGDTLLGASSTASRVAEVHEMTMDGAVMRMRELAGGLPLPPGQTVTLQPSGLHIMLVDLKAPLKQGGTVQVRLNFAHSAPVDITARVAAIGAAGPPDAVAPPALPGMKIP